MAFIDQRINSRYRMGFVGGPAWNTLKVELANGRQRRKKQWSMPHHRYTANYATLNELEKNELLSAFMVAGGSFSAFRFLDYNDFRATSELIGVGDGTSNPLQLVKTYSFGSSSFTRTITLPLNPVIYVDGIEEPGVTVDQLTGMVAPDSAWPTDSLVTWTGTFDVRVCFANDFNPFTSPASNIRECMVDLLEDFG